MIAYLHFVLATAVIAKPLADVMSPLLATTFFAVNTSNVRPLNAPFGFPNNPSYAVYRGFSDDSCTDLAFTRSWLLNTCVASATTSGMVTCSNNVAIYATYSDTTCTTPSATVPISATTCTFNALLQTCSTPDAYGFGNGNFFAGTNYQDASCEEVLQATAYVNGVCQVAGATTSVMFKWPNVYQYSASTNCQGASIITDVSNYGCVYSGAGDDDYFHYSSYLSFSNVINDGDKGSKTLSTGAIVGIVIGAVTGSLLLGVVAYLLLFSRTKSALSGQQAGIEATKV